MPVGGKLEEMRSKRLRIPGSYLAAEKIRVVGEGSETRTFQIVL